MNTFTVEFKSLNPGQLTEWFTWDSFPISTDLNEKLRYLRMYYPQYEWRAA